ncbi:SulP family sulfate permease [Allofrancisella inopinata]|uniref:SulP family inorganic anion transporter n=1 Tax=Allofrancisella inopinata TaxID=1085647 RepID=A0AAE6YHC2_9GAMM|nr:SulP family inorganic anion transporter [Allofrancisella inopinata]QIV95935.1 SulP family inorganic anion transporter [Allofrancisella inopinata]TDT74354.1 SulP family sulfate permease [Allofrancisella inopinata]
MKQSINNFLMPFGGSYRVDFLSGLTVALALVPEAVAFSLVAGVNPTVGLWGAFFMCIITAIIGGRPGMISGATGSMAIVMISIMLLFPGDPVTGLSYLMATVLLTGVIEVVIGVLGLGKFIRMMPKSVMVGFVNGLAIVIFISQIQSFRISPPGVEPSVWISGASLWIMISLVLLAMAITHYLPRFTKLLPSALTAIIVVTLIVVFVPMPASVSMPTVGSLMAMSGDTVSHGFSIPHIPLSLETLKIIVPYAFILAIIGLSESLMTLVFIDERTQTRGRGNKECIAQGVGNIVSSFFKGMGGCAMIGQSMINISSGGRGRLSGITAGVFLLIFIIAAMPLIKIIPLAALIGVMMMVVIETFEWASFKMMRRVPKKDVLLIIVVTITTVMFDLAIAVVIGIIIASLVFSWETAKNIWAAERTNENGEKEYIIHGPLFFSSTTSFKGLFKFAKDPEEVIIDFKYSRVADQSAIDAIQWVADKYTKLGKRLHLRHLNQECKILLGKAGNLVELNILEDEDYHIATDRLA